MAMLAEPRRRKRYNFCPRGKPLYEDNKRFGTIMLEKMGWSKGKGLGAQEDGEPDFVRVRLKNGAEGLGYEARDDQWTTHEESFNVLLKSLHGGESNNESLGDTSDVEMHSIGFGFKTDSGKPTKVKKLKEKLSGVSLEERSKQSKARVHYKKFTRGKDLTQYTENDLANIFGKKAVEKRTFEAPLATTITESVEAEKKEVNANFGGVQTISTGLSVSDYFKKKLEAMKSKLNNGALGNGPKIQPLTFDREELTEILETETISGNDQTAKKKKKKQDKEKMLPFVPIEEAASKLAIKDVNVNDDQNESKKKKKSKHIYAAEQNDIKETKYLDTETDVPKKKRKIKLVSLESVPIEMERISEPKRKKKNKEKHDDRDDLVAAAVAGEPIELSPKAVTKKKKKSTKSADSELETDACQKTESDKVAVGKKKKDKRINSEQLDPTDGTAEPASKKKKKSKKSVDSASVKSDAELHMNVSESPTVAAKRKQKLDVSVAQTKAADISCSSEKYDESVEDQQEQLLSLEELIAKQDSYDVYTISSFCAEKFYMFNMNAFKESTLGQIPGYAATANMKLEVVEMKKDAQRIVDLWSGTSNKYGTRKPKFKKTKAVKLSTLKSIKRRNAFSGF